MKGMLPVLEDLLHDHLGVDEMDSRTRRQMKTLSSGFFSAVSLGCLLTAFVPLANAEILFGASTPAPGASVAAQSAQYNRQRAIVERARNDNGDFQLSPNIVLTNGFNSWGGVNPWGSVNAWAATGSPAAAGAAYNRQRAIVEQSRNSNGEFWHSPNIIMNEGFNAWGGVNSWGRVTAGTPTGSAAATGAAYNRQRAVANQVFMGNESTSSKHSARANAYRNQGH